VRDVRSGQSGHAERRHHRGDPAPAPGARRPQFPEHHELPVRQDPRAADPRRRRRGAPRVRRRVRHAERAARQGAMPGGRLRLPRRRRAASAGPRRTPGSSGDRPGGDVGTRRRGSPQRRPAAGPRSRPVAVPRPREPAPRLRRIDAARRARGPVDGAVHDDADLARLSVAVRVLRHPDLQRRQVALPHSAARGGRVHAPPTARLRVGLLRGTRRFHGSHCFLAFTVRGGRV